MEKTLRRARLPGAVLIVLLAAGAGWRFAGEWPQLIAGVTGLGAWGPIAYVALYAAAAVAFVPGSVLTVAAGALFGLWPGVVYALTGATLGATAAFAVARWIGRGWVERRVARDPRVAALDRAIAARGRTVVLLLRLSPVVPFTLLNYALGLTRVRFRDYLAGSVGMVPAAFAYVYSGTVAREAALVLSGAAQPSPAEHALLVAGLAATVVVVVLLVRAARRALGEIERS